MFLFVFVVVVGGGGGGGGGRFPVSFFLSFFPVFIATCDISIPVLVLFMFFDDLL